MVIAGLSLDMGFLDVFEDGGELETDVVVGFLEHVGVVRVFCVEVVDDLFREVDGGVHVSKWDE